MGLALIHSVIAILQQHQPWLADKIGGALVAQPVRELWELVKMKLGPSTEKVEPTPDDSGQWEVFRAKLLVALDEDPDFREKIAKLVSLTELETGAISQTAKGTDIQQVGVNNSKHVRISVK
jgi:hypothetical protein